MGQQQKTLVLVARALTVCKVGEFSCVFDVCKVHFFCSQAINFEVGHILRFWFLCESMQNDDLDLTWFVG